MRSPRAFSNVVGQHVSAGLFHSGRALIQQSHLGVRSAMEQQSERGSLASRGKIPVHLSSPWLIVIPAPQHHRQSFVPLETVSTAESLQQTQQPDEEGALELGMYQETGLAIRREVAATHGTQPLRSLRIPGV